MDDYSADLLKAGACWARSSGSANPEIDAEEAFANTAIRGYLRLSSFDPNRSSGARPLFAWLHGILRNELRRLMAVGRRATGSKAMDEGRTAAAAWMPNYVTRLAIKEVLTLLNDETQTETQGRYVRAWAAVQLEGWTWQEAAERLCANQGAESLRAATSRHIHRILAAKGIEE